MIASASRETGKDRYLTRVRVGMAISIFYDFYRDIFLPLDYQIGVKFIIFWRDFREMCHRLLLNDSATYYS